jgi:integrase
VFWLPVGDGAKDWLHRDLEAAGLGHLLHAGQQVDFHSLRATAITWWLQAGLDQLQVQRLARLKTLAVLQRYTRIGQRRMGAEWVMGMSLMTGRGPAGATRKRA